MNQTTSQNGPPPQIYLFDDFFHSAELYQQFLNNLTPYIFISQYPGIYGSIKFTLSITSHPLFTISMWDNSNNNNPGGKFHFMYGYCLFVKIKCNVLISCLISFGSNHFFNHFLCFALLR